MSAPSTIESDDEDHSLHEAEEINNQQPDDNDEQVEEEEGEAAGDDWENPQSQEVIDKYSNQLNDAIFSSNVDEVRRLSQLESVRSYTPYHLNQLEIVLSSGYIKGKAQEQCWEALASAWPDSIEENLGHLMRAAVQGGPLTALRELIQRVRQRSSSHAAFLASLKGDESYLNGDDRKSLFEEEKLKF